MMNHESRIKRLEEQVAMLLAERKEKNKWVGIREACQQLDLSYSVIRKAIVQGFLKHRYDWKKNGNRYLVNVDKLREKLQ